jgi:3'(2'), 5'-bisphosphate nucleotidase
MKLTDSIELKSVLDVIYDANEAVLAIYNSPESIDVTYKTDNSPLTQADTTSHAILAQGLQALDTAIPVVSEEQSSEENEKAKQKDYYWLIDPIDGTKEFISRVGQFTICVALMHNGQPIFGIVSAPALGELYYGGKDFSSYKVVPSGGPKLLPLHTPPRKIYGSISNTNAATKQYIEDHYQDYDVESVGSQLKFTYVAEGKAAAYPRVGTDMKLWVIAAGHAIIEGAGGVVERPDGTSIDYNDPDFLAGDFVAKIS